MKRLITLLIILLLGACSHDDLPDPEVDTVIITDEGCGQAFGVTSRAGILMPYIWYSYTMSVLDSNTVDSVFVLATIYRRNGEGILSQELVYEKPYTQDGYLPFQQYTEFSWWTWEVDEMADTVYYSISLICK